MLPPNRRDGGCHTGTPWHPSQPLHPGLPGCSRHAAHLAMRRATAAIRYLTASYYLLDSDQEALDHVAPAAIVDAFIRDVADEGWVTMQQDLERAIDNGWIAAVPDGYQLTPAGLSGLQEG